MYVKQVALAMGALGHKVDIITRQIVDPAWPEFTSTFVRYPNASNVRIVRLPAGPPGFLRKELLWSYLIRDWIPNILKFFQQESEFHAVFAAHYGNGRSCGFMIEEKTGIPFTFAEHALGAQKMDKLGTTPSNLLELDACGLLKRLLRLN